MRGDDWTLTSLIRWLSFSRARGLHRKSRLPNRCRRMASATNVPTAGECGCARTVTKATSTITTSLSSSTIQAGQSVYDSATLAGISNPDGSGTVTYTVYTDSGCTAALLNC